MDYYFYKHIYHFIERRKYDMWLELFAWIESFASVSFDPSDVLDVAVPELAFLDPYGWKSNLEVALDDVVELLNTLEEHRLEAPDSLGEISEVKTDYTRQVVGEIIEKVNAVKMQMNLEVTKIAGLDGLRSNIALIAKLIDYCKDNSMEAAISSAKFDEFNTENDNDITNVLGIQVQDMLAVYQSVDEISELYDEDDMEDSSEYQNDQVLGDFGVV